MQIIKKINNSLYKKFGDNVYLHFVNDSISEYDENAKPLRGRVYFHLFNKTLHVSWNVWSDFCHSYIHFGPGGDEDATISVAIPPIALWFSIQGFIPYEFWQKYFSDYYTREIGFSIHNGRVWGDFFGKEGCWSKEDPWWHHFNFTIDPREILFGDMKYSSRVIEEKEVEVPMPEKTYKAKMKLCADTWSRKRFPMLKNTIIRVYTDMIEPIPFPGKGTASYNCGDDALHGMTCPARNFEEAIGKIVESVLTNRRRYPL